MSYSFVTRTAFGDHVLNYVLSEKGHNNAERRNEIVTPINMSKGVSYNRQMRRNWLRASIKHKIQLIQIIQSFSKKEFDPTNPYDIVKANQLGQELVDTHYPGRQALVCTQIDGKGGCVHNHILINDVSMCDGKGCTKEQYFHPNIRKWTDEITEKYTIRDEGENEDDRLTRVDIERRLKEEFLYKDELRIRIINAMDKSLSEQDFFDYLKENGVDVVKRSSKKYGEFYTYELVDLSCVPVDAKLPKHALKSRSYKLGSPYGPKALQEHINTKKRGIEGRFTTDEYLEELRAKMLSDDVSKAEENFVTSADIGFASERYDDVMQTPDIEVMDEITEEKISEIHISKSAYSDSVTEGKTVEIPIETTVQTEPVSTIANNVQLQSDYDSDEEQEDENMNRRKGNKQCIRKKAKKKGVVPKDKDFFDKRSSNLANTGLSEVKNNVVSDEDEREVE